MSDFRNQIRKVRKEAVRRVIERARQGSEKTITGIAIAAALGVNNFRQVQEMVRPRSGTPGDEHGEGAGIGAHDVAMLPPVIRDALLREIADACGFVIAPKPEAEPTAETISVATAEAMEKAGKLIVEIGMRGADGRFDDRDKAVIAAAGQTAMSAMAESLEAVKAHGGGRS